LEKKKKKIIHCFTIEVSRAYIYFPAGTYKSLRDNIITGLTIDPIGANSWCILVYTKMHSISAKQLWPGYDPIHTKGKEINIKYLYE
jgi:hypothetical protein